MNPIIAKRLVSIGSPPARVEKAIHPKKINVYKKALTSISFMWIGEVWVYDIANQQFVVKKEERTIFDKHCMTNVSSNLGTLILWIIIIQHT